MLMKALTDPKEQGLTFVELIIVIVCVGILGAIVLPGWLEHASELHHRRYARLSNQVPEHSSKLIAPDSHLKPLSNLNAGTAEAFGITSQDGATLSTTGFAPVVLPLSKSPNFSYPSPALNQASSKE